MNQEQPITAFTNMLEQYKALVYKIARSYTQHPDDCQDLVQEIVLALWKAFPRYNSQYQYSTWIYRIALNCSISHLRKESHRIHSTESLSEELIHLTRSEENNTHDANIELLYQFIGGLKELDKALMLLYLDEKSHREMAEILGLSETNIATKISRIKEKLRLQFSRQNH